MNNRTRELFGKALDAAIPETWTSLDPEQIKKVSDKFAELIVQECAQLCDTEASFAGSNGRKDASASNCATAIKQHFGVE